MRDLGRRGGGRGEEVQDEQARGREKIREFSSLGGGRANGKGSQRMSWYSPANKQAFSETAETRFVGVVVEETYDGDARGREKTGRLRNLGCWMARRANEKGKQRICWCSTLSQPASTGIARAMIRCNHNSRPESQVLTARQEEEWCVQRMQTRAKPSVSVSVTGQMVVLIGTMTVVVTVLWAGQSVTETVRSLQS